MINSNLTEQQLLMKYHYIGSWLSILRGHELCAHEGSWINIVAWGPIMIHCDAMQSQKKEFKVFKENKFKKSVVQEIETHREFMFNDTSLCKSHAPQHFLLLILCFCVLVSVKGHKRQWYCFKLSKSFISKGWSHQIRVIDDYLILFLFTLCCAL